MSALLSRNSQHTAGCHRHRPGRPGYRPASAPRRTRATSWCSTSSTSTGSPRTRSSTPTSPAWSTRRRRSRAAIRTWVPRCWSPTASTLIDDAGPEVFKKIKDGAKIRLHDGGVYAGDRRLIHGTERSDQEIVDLMHEAKSGLVAHLEAFAGNTIEFIRSESPLLIDGIGIPDIDVDLYRRHVVVVAEEPGAADDLKALKPFIKEYQPVLVGVGSRRRRAAQGRLPSATDRRRPRADEHRGAQVRRAGGAARRRRRSRRRSGAHPGPRRRGDDVPGRGFGRRPGAAAGRSPRRLADRHRRPHRQHRGVLRPVPPAEQPVDLPDPAEGGREAGRRQSRCDAVPQPRSPAAPSPCWCWRC